VVYPQERGETQLETRPTRQIDSDGRISALGLIAEYGLTDRWQVETEWDGPVWNRPMSGPATSGVGNVSAGSKIAFRCISGSPYHVSIGVDVELPTSTIEDTDGDDADVRLAPMATLGRDVGGAGHIFTAIVLAAPLTHRGDRTARWTFASDTGMFVRVVRGFRATAELSADGGPQRRTDVLFVPGLLWHWRDRVEIGVAMSIAVSHDAPHGLLTHLVYELGGEHDGKKK
jgi:hypothetical protein